MVAETLVISKRFCGPPQSGNGGYVCGLLAKDLSGAAAVRLKAPPPLEVALRIEGTEHQVRLFHESILIAEANLADHDLSPPPPPSFAEAEEASQSYVYFREHPFPTCFVCGPQRVAGDGLRIFPGLIERRSLVAAPWVPDASLAVGSSQVSLEFMWSALDCSSAFSFLPLPEGKVVVLGKLWARIEGAVLPREKCVVVGWLLGVEGRKRFAGSAIYAEQGHPVAVARATWIEVSRSAFTSA